MQNFVVTIDGNEYEIQAGYLGFDDPFHGIRGSDCVVKILEDGEVVDELNLGIHVDPVEVDEEFVANAVKDHGFTIVDGKSLGEALYNYSAKYVAAKGKRG